MSILFDEEIRITERSNKEILEARASLLVLKGAAMAEGLAEDVSGWGDCLDLVEEEMLKRNL